MGAPCDGYRAIVLAMARGTGVDPDAVLSVLMPLLPPERSELLMVLEDIGLIDDAHGRWLTDQAATLAPTAGERA